MSAAFKRRVLAACCAFAFMLAASSTYSQEATCGQCGGTNDFIEIERENGSGNYVAAICGCEIASLGESNS